MTEGRVTDEGAGREEVGPDPDRNVDAERSADEQVDALDGAIEVPLDAPIEVPVADLVDQLSTVPIPEDEDR